MQKPYPDLAKLDYSEYSPELNEYKSTMYRLHALESISTDNVEEIVTLHEKLSALYDRLSSDDRNFVNRLHDVLER